MRNEELDFDFDFHYYLHFFFWFYTKQSIVFVKTISMTEFILICFAKWIFIFNSILIFILLQQMVSKQPFFVYKIRIHLPKFVEWYRMILQQNLFRIVNWPGLKIENVWNQYCIWPCVWLCICDKAVLDEIETNALVQRPCVVSIMLVSYHLEMLAPDIDNSLPIFQ